MSENNTVFSDFGIDLLGGATTETYNDNHGTTFQHVPHTPPPPGYYGDTRELLIKVVTPIIITFGTIGNILTVMVLMRQTKKISSTSMYLLVLAVSDTGLLWTSPFRVWLKGMWDIDIRYLSDASCRIHLYFSYAFIHFSSWMLVAVTLERTIGVVSPHKVKLCCTPRSAGVVITSIFVFLFGIDLVIPLISSIDGYQPLDGHEPVQCAPSTKDYSEFRDNIWLWIDLSISSLIPLVCLVTGNALIVWQLQKAKKIQHAMNVSREKRAKRTCRRGTLSVTMLMIALCVIFFLTMTPVAVYEIYYPYRFAEIIEMFFVDPYKAWESYQYFLLQHTIVNLVSYTNASLNFVLYVFSGTRFRAELKSALCCLAKARDGLFTSVKKSTMSRSVTPLATKSENQSSESTSVNTDTQYGENKNMKYIDADYLSRDNLVFTSDDGISSLSSILSQHVDKSIEKEQTEIDDCESFDDVFNDYEIIFSTDPTQDTIYVVEGKELNGFILHL